jgi:ectoine hydroxylase-related dioxygenase (phytanoyl-CoA dioxygenase family)
MLALDITPAEVQSGQMSPDHLDAAVQAIRDDGFVVLNDVINLAHIDALRERMLEDLQAILAREDTPFNWNATNVQQDPPPFHPYLFRDVLLNDMAIAVTKAILGAGLKNTFYSGNTALPGDFKQPVHPDMAQLWPNLTVAPPPHALIVNVPVVDMSAENGSTELWPGTHLDTRMFVQKGHIEVPEEWVEARRAEVPPIQPSVRKGSLLIRDGRLWHRGMPNHTDAPRPMIAMIHVIKWWPQSPARFAKGTEDFFEHPDLATNAVFVDDLDHIQHNKGYKYEKQ